MSPSLILFLVCLVTASLQYFVVGETTVCDPSLCLNGGTCLVDNSPSGFMCNCSRTGYTGARCNLLEPQCEPEAAVSLLWKQTRKGKAFKCSNVNTRLGGFMVKRSCTSDGWSRPDFSSCLFNDTVIDKAFLLLWIPFTVQTVSQVILASPQVVDEITELISVNAIQTIQQDRITEVPGQSYVSVTYIITLNVLKPTDTLVTLLTERFAGLFQSSSFAGLSVSQGVSFGVQGFYATESCACTQPDGLFSGLCDAIVPVSACNCSQSNGLCECFGPYFVGNGQKCTTDTDGDGFPNVPLSVSVCSSPSSSDTFCTMDNCPEIYNPEQESYKCVQVDGFSGCMQNEDEDWEVTWGNTYYGDTDLQRCPGGPGFITRFCSPNGWEPAVASGCGSYLFSNILTETEEILLDSDDINDRLSNIAEVLQNVKLFTSPGSSVSLLPSDLSDTNSIMATALQLLEEVLQTGDTLNIPNFNLDKVLSNVLSERNLNGWLSRQKVGPGSQKLMDNAERYALYLSKSLNETDRVPRTWQRDNLVIGFQRTEPTEKDYKFPESEESINSTFSTLPAQITLPRSFIQEMMVAGDQSVPVSNIIFRNMERALPTRKNTTMVASMVLSTQVSSRSSVSSALTSNPAVISFTFDSVANAMNYKCAFWNFSNPVGSGSWQEDGVKMMKKEVSNDSSKVTIFCNATHLTSFAILVDVSGTLNNVSAQELQALQIVSYIGCVISLVCLILTIIFFIAMGREVFKKVHYFIHLNLAIVLFLAYLMFVVGVEPARVNTGACAFVAAWLHYFFLSSFSWMLCEGIMLYLMLVLVFSKLSRKWWFFMIIGYGLPVIPVVITLGVRPNDYGVTDTNGTLQNCWLSTSNGVIWGFVGPMILIILVNLVFMVLALVMVFKSSRKTVRRSKGSNDEKISIKETKQLFKKLFIATLVLLPILGITWVFGLFTVNANTTVFAWLFTIFNSLQGAFIFFFHVLRTDKIWNNKRVKSVRSTISSRVTSTTIIKQRSSTYILKRNTTSTSLLPSLSNESNMEKFTLSNDKSELDLNKSLSLDKITERNSSLDSNDSHIQSADDSNSPQHDCATETESGENVYKYQPEGDPELCEMTPVKGASDAEVDVESIGRSIEDSPQSVDTALTRNDDSLP